MHTHLPAVRVCVHENTPRAGVSMYTHQHVELSLVLMGGSNGVVVLALQPGQVRNGRVHLVLTPVKLLQHALRVLDACKANVRPRLHLRHLSLARIKPGLDARHAGTRRLHLLPPARIPLRRCRRGRLLALVCRLHL